MTIETRMSYPEGGTECPPDESPLPTSSSATSPMQSHATCNTPSNSCNRTFLGSSKPSTGISNSQQRCKLRSHKSMSSQITGREESSENILKAITVNRTEIETDNTCTNGEDSTGDENLEDLKKPIKMKSMVAVGSKEEAVSRKSMRLRLRRGKTDHSKDSFGPKERPRYVEDLISIDFDDDKAKVMFMDALGMSPKSKRAKLDLQPQSTLCSKLERNEIVHDEVQTEEKVGYKESQPVSTDGTTAKPTVLDDQQAQAFPHSNASTADSDQTPANTDQHGPNNDDESGWECWVKRISSSYKSKPANTSPTKSEINESLIRLTRLGTAVKVVRPGLS